MSARLFVDLAHISAMLKMYPLAMKCYGKALLLNKKTIFENSGVTLDSIAARLSIADST